MVTKEKLFIGVFPAGIGYADRSKEEHGDYKTVAFLSYETLKLDIRSPRSSLLPEIKEHAARLQAKRGFPFVVSGCGQTVLLGGSLPHGLCSEFRRWLAEVGKPSGRTPEQVYALWLDYTAKCCDQSAICSEFEEWYKDALSTPITQEVVR